MILSHDADGLCSADERLNRHTPLAVGGGTDCGSNDGSASDSVLVDAIAANI